MPRPRALLLVALGLWTIGCSHELTGGAQLSYPLILSSTISVVPKTEWGFMGQIQLGIAGGKCGIGYGYQSPVMCGYSMSGFRLSVLRRWSEVDIGPDYIGIEAQHVCLFMWGMSLGGYWSADGASGSEDFLVHASLNYGF
jgi:hypothetical protein